MTTEQQDKVIVLIGAGSIGLAITRRVAAGKKVLVADLKQELANTAAETLRDAGFDVAVTSVDVSSRASLQALVKAATDLGHVFGVVHAAGVSPPQAFSLSTFTAQRLCSKSLPM